MHSDVFNKFLLICTLVFLCAFGWFKWTSEGREQLMNVVNIEDLFGIIPNCISKWNKRPIGEMNQYKKLLIILTSNWIGMTFSRGTHQ